MVGFWPAAEISLLLGSGDVSEHEAPLCRQRVITSPPSPDPHLRHRCYHRRHHEIPRQPPNHCCQGDATIFAVIFAVTMVMPLHIAITLTSANFDTVISIVTGIISGCTSVSASPAVLLAISDITVATPSSSSPNIITCISGMIAITNPTATTLFLIPAITTTSSTIPTTIHHLHHLDPQKQH